MAKTNGMYGDEQKSIPISFLSYLMRTNHNLPIITTSISQPTKVKVVADHFSIVVY